MKTGLTTSVILHTAALAFGLFTLSAPAALPAADVELVAVDIVPMEAIAQTLQGDKKAVMHEKPAPLPTQRPDIVPEAQKIGENSVDTDKPITPEAKPKPVDTTSAPPPAPTPIEKPKPEDVPKPQEKPKPIPATEVAPAPQPKARGQARAGQADGPQADTGQAGADPAAAGQDRRNRSDARGQAGCRRRGHSQGSAYRRDAAAELGASAGSAAEAAAGAGRKRQGAGPQGCRQAGQGSLVEAEVRRQAVQRRRDFRSARQAEAVRRRRQALDPAGVARRRQGPGPEAVAERRWAPCRISSAAAGPFRWGSRARKTSSPWSVFNLDASGKLDGRPTVEKSSGNRQFDESAVRAVQKCNMAGLQVPAGKQDIWAEVRVTFDPREMLGPLGPASDKSVKRSEKT